jgi:hypothetical protein
MIRSRPLPALFALAAFVSLTALSLPLQADPGIKNAWLAAYPDACSSLKSAANGCTLCHTSVPTRNDYGKDLGTADPKTIENLDSDGDGKKNGQEILDCTLPGDPTSILPADAPTWGAIKVLYR